MSSTRRYALLLAATAPLPACSDPPPATETANVAAPVRSLDAPAAPNQALPAAVPVENATSPAEAAKVEADYIGRWVGPEGLMLEVKSKPGGGVTVVNQYTLDDKGTFDGSVTAEGLRFVRNGQAVTAVPSTGDATGMKWLAGKQDCLTVIPQSEGYCRQ